MIDGMIIAGFPSQSIARPPSALIIILKPPLRPNRLFCHTTEIAASGATHGMKKNVRNSDRHLLDSSEQRIAAVTSVTQMLIVTIART